MDKIVLETYDKPHKDTMCYTIDEDLIAWLNALVITKKLKSASWLVNTILRYAKDNDIIEM
jgi:hypothetical protein